MKTTATVATQDIDAAAAEKGLTRVTGIEWRSLSLAGLGWTFESYDSFLLSLLLPTLALQFGLNKAQLGMFTSVTAAGQIIGGILFGFVSDRIGRVRTALLCVGIYSLFSGLIAFAPDAHAFATLRFSARSAWAGPGPRARRSSRRPGIRAGAARAVR